MISCPAGQSSRGSALITDSCPLGIAQSGISLTHEARVCQILGRGAESAITLDQRAPGYWDLTTTSVIVLADTSDRLRAAFGDAVSTLLVTTEVDTTGGRVEQPSTQRCVTQINHGLAAGNWITLDSNTGEWTQSFDPSATLVDDSVASVVSVEDMDHFCYKPIGPFCQAPGLLPGRVYYVETDGSGDITLTDPLDVSVPRLFAISETEGILLPYRPKLPSDGGGGPSTTQRQDVFDVDAGIVAGKVIILTYTPVLGSELVYVNGVMATSGREYTISGVTITFEPTSDIRVGDLLTVRYES